MRNVALALLAVIAIDCHAAAFQAANVDLTAQNDIERTLAKGSADDYSIQMAAGESALVIVKQEGADVVVEVRAPDGTLLDSVDSPTGRNGDEVVELFAKETGPYGFRVLPIAEDEPVGKYRISVRERRTRQQTDALLAERQELLDEASTWIASRSAEIPASGVFSDKDRLPLLDALADRARVLGLGEATHGSREFGDVRLSITKRLIRLKGFRVVAVEGSTTGMRIIAPYVQGDSEKTPEINRVIESGWIGRRSRRELIEWLRTWNLQHRNDRIALVGVDPQENRKERETLRSFLQRAYPPEVAKQWTEVEKELNDADEQTPVFGDSGVNNKAVSFVVELLAKLSLDAPILRARFGEDAFQEAWEAAKALTEFSDFNSGGNGPLAHSRDWYMAAEILRAIQNSATSSKAIYWAHNAHIASTRARYQPTGAILRSALGCKYAGLAITFGEGAFVAQIPNDEEDRLATSSLEMAANGSIEAVVAHIRKGARLAVWRCNSYEGSAPAWLKKPEPMHWIGGLYKPGTLPSASYRSFDLLHDFDGVIYLPKVSADEAPTDRPLIPGRKR